jgi:hypothetical protein
MPYEITIKTQNKTFQTFHQVVLLYDIGAPCLKASPLRSLLQSLGTTQAEFHTKKAFSFIIYKATYVPMYPVKKKLRLQ